MTLHLSERPARVTATVKRTARIKNAAAHSEPAPAAAPMIPESYPDLAFLPAPSRKPKAGWTADRQRRFIDTLALTGSVAEAAEEAEVDPRSAYRLRDRPGGEDFARAWGAALGCAATRLVAILLDRAVNGRSERIYNAQGALVHERRVPSDDLLKWLLTRLDPMTYGSPFVRAAAIATGHDPRGAARSALPAAMAALGDVDPADCPLPRVLLREHRENEAPCGGDITAAATQD